MNQTYGGEAMNYFGAYHADIRAQAQGICDAPRITKGRMSLSGFECASDAQCIALVHGRLRNRSALAASLNCPPYTTPAQLVLKAYAAWGEDFIRRIEGPCLCCIADVQADRMIVARDRMGENALFYARRGEGLVFADHPDMLIKAALLEPAADREGLCEIFGLGPARTPGKTPLKGLEELKPGCMLVCTAEGIEIRRHYELTACGHEENAQETIDHVRALLEECVNDVVNLHPACMLSGGLDSTALAALLSMRIGRLNSFSVDYRGNDEDFVANSFRPEMDAPYIHLAVREFGTRHHSIILEQDALAENLNRAMRARGFPGMADIDASLLLFAREIARNAPNVVSGECGDEVFGGYPWFRGEARLPEDVFPWSGSLQLRQEILRPEIREKLNLQEYVRQRLHQALDGYDVSAVEGEEEKVLFKLQRLCFDFFMPNLQERAVKLCEIHGLNVITPLCDDRLVEYVYNVPWKMKFMGGAEKGLFRAAMQDVLPEKLRMRKKSPYPKTCSAAYTSIIRGRMRALCADSGAPVWQLVDVGQIERLASSRLDPAQAPWYGQLMAGPQMLGFLLQLNAWLRERNVAIDL